MMIHHRPQRHIGDFPFGNQAGGRGTPSAMSNTRPGLSKDDCISLRTAGFACNNPDYPEWDHHGGKDDPDSPFWQLTMDDRSAGMQGEAPGNDPAADVKKLLDKLSKLGQGVARGSKSGVPWLWIALAVGAAWFANKKGWI